MSGGSGMATEPAISEAIVDALGRRHGGRLRGFAVGSGSVPLTAVGQVPFAPVGTAGLQVPTRLVRTNGDPARPGCQDVFPQR